MDISSIRNHYLLHALNETETGDDPVKFFIKWMSQAIEAQVAQPTATVLSTINKECRPSSRVVLLKGIENGAFLFFTNYNSDKGTQISNNPAGAMVFFWNELERQVRIEGHIQKIPTADSDRYFDNRPFESKIGAVVSPQSKVIENRAYLESLFDARLKTYNSDNILTRPDYWGGYALMPDTIEFWQGRASRLHDRIRFRLKDHLWIRERLAP